MMTPSGLKEFQGCRLISTIRSVFSERSRKEGCFLARSRYTCWYRPACRIILQRTHATTSGQVGMGGQMSRQEMARSEGG